MSTAKRAPGPDAAPSEGAAARPAMTRTPFGMIGMAPPQKAKHFKQAGRRLMARLAPERNGVIAVLGLAVSSVALGLPGWAILGKATDVIVAGFFGAHTTEVAQAHSIAAVRAVGNHPGHGIAFSDLRFWLVLALVLYLGSSLFTWLQGYVLNHLVQRTVRGLRADVQAKLSRLPLSYFDLQPRGEILSRVTNDIENVATSLQMSMNQLLNGLLNVVGVLIVLLVISPLLAIIAVVTVPISIALSAKIAKRSQRRFVAQWAHVGALNGQIEEAFTGHSLVKVFGRRREVEQRFAAKNAELFDAGYRAQFISSLIGPVIQVIANLNYVAIAVVGGLRVAWGTMTLGSVQAFVGYSRQFAQQLGQLAQVASVLQSGVASAERVFEVLDAEEQVLDRRRRRRSSGPLRGCAARSGSSTCRSATSRISR